MSGEQRGSARRRRTRVEVQQLVAEFVSSGMPRTVFCRSRGLSFSTLDRHLKNLKKRKRTGGRTSSASDSLLPVELADAQPMLCEPSCALAVVLSGSRRIEVRRDFDAETFRRLVSILERA